jgi:hypothetical protein
MAEGAARVDAVALEPVPAAPEVEPRGVAVPVLALRPLQTKPHEQREAPLPIRQSNYPTKQRPRHCGRRQALARDEARES